MYMSLPHFVLGFHGCDRETGEAILAGGVAQTPSANAYDWLGHGCYFWEGNPARADEYARELKTHPVRTKGTVSEPFVIGAVIDPGRCLNLLENGSLQIVKEAHALLERMAAVAGNPLPENKPVEGQLLLRDLDCAVIEALHSHRKQDGLPPFDTVRGMFAEGPELYRGAGFRSRNHIQICVRNPNCIKGYFRVRAQDSAYPVP